MLTVQESSLSFCLVLESCEHQAGKIRTLLQVSGSAESSTGYGRSAIIKIPDIPLCTLPPRPVLLSDFLGGSGNETNLKVSLRIILITGIYGKFLVMKGMFMCHVNTDPSPLILLLSMPPDEIYTISCS